MNKHLILLPVGLTLSLGGLALAQSDPDGIDLDKIRERAAQHTEEAQALATNVRERAEALTEDAQGVQVQAQANRASYADSIDSHRDGRRPRLRRDDRGPGGSRESIARGKPRALSPLPACRCRQRH